MAAHAEARRRGEPGARRRRVDVRWPGFSGMVYFRHPDAVGWEATDLFTLAGSLGGVESLVEVPQAMTHQSVEGSEPRSRPTSSG